jgi:hypothetical protein
MSHISLEAFRTRDPAPEKQDASTISPKNAEVVAVEAFD